MGKRSRAAAAEERDDVSVAVEKLQRVQQELEKVYKEASEEILEIEQKCIEKRKPVYARRNKIISQIPNFWLTIFLNHPTFQNLLTEEDEKIFEYLDSINVDYFEDPRKGYCITFNFKNNPFFKNRKLTKTITVLDDRIARSNGTMIKWKVGKGPDKDKGPAKDKRKREKRPLSLDSFFSWFSSPEEDDSVAEIIRKDIWPNPIDDLDNLEDEDDDYDDEDDDNSDDDEEEEDAD